MNRMDRRRSDPRIYIVTLLFLSCIISGGVLLGLYLLLSDPNPLFLQAGMACVGVPWLFWFLAYVYSCLLKPCTVIVSKKNVVNFDAEKGEQNNNDDDDDDFKIPENTTLASDPVATATTTPRDGERHVQFGNVVVLGDEEGDRNEGSSNNLILNLMGIEEQENQEDGSSNSRSDDDDDDGESSVNEDCDRTPLRLSVGNR